MATLSSTGSPQEVSERERVLRAPPGNAPRRVAGSRAWSCREAALLVCQVVCLMALAQAASPSNIRVKRALYELPAGAQQVLGPDIRTSFSCEGLGYGYYADTDNACKIFHVCQSFKMSDGSIYNNHWSFMCGNQTVFNQVLLACAHPEDAIPCESSKDFYYINDYFGDLESPSVKENDLNMAQDLITRAYGSRAPKSSPTPAPQFDSFGGGGGDNGETTTTGAPLSS